MYFSKFFGDGTPTWIQPHSFLFDARPTSSGVWSRPTPWSTAWDEDDLDPFGAWLTWRFLWSFRDRKMGPGVSRCGNLGKLLESDRSIWIWSGELMISESIWGHRDDFFWGVTSFAQIRYQRDSRDAVKHLSPQRQNCDVRKAVSPGAFYPHTNEQFYFEVQFHF